MLIIRIVYSTEKSAMFENKRESDTVKGIGHLITWQVPGFSNKEQNACNGNAEMS